MGKELKGILISLLSPTAASQTGSCRTFRKAWCRRTWVGVFWRSNSNSINSRWRRLLLPLRAGQRTGRRRRRKEETKLRRRFSSGDRRRQHTRRFPPFNVPCFLLTLCLSNPEVSGHRHISQTFVKKENLDFLQVSPEMRASCQKKRLALNTGSSPLINSVSLQ